MCRPFPEEHCAFSYVGFRKMRVVKSDHGYAQRASDLQSSPAELIGVGRLHDVRLLPVQNFFHCAKIQQCAVLRRPRHKRRTNRVNMRASVCFHFRLRAGNNKNVFVARRMPVDVIDLFMKISLHAAAYRRIKLSEVADLHVLVIPSEARRSRGIPRNNLIVLPRDPSTPLRMTREVRGLQTQSCDPSSLRNFSACSAAAQPIPAAVTACLYTRSATSPAMKTPGTLLSTPFFGSR